MSLDTRKFSYFRWRFALLLALAPSGCRFYAFAYAFDGVALLTAPLTLPATLLALPGVFLPICRCAWEATFLPAFLRPDTMITPSSLFEELLAELEVDVLEDDALPLPEPKVDVESEVEWSPLSELVAPGIQSTSSSTLGLCVPYMSPPSSQVVVVCALPSSTLVSFMWFVIYGALWFSFSLGFRMQHAPCFSTIHLAISIVDAWNKGCACCK